MTPLAGLLDAAVRHLPPDRARSLRLAVRWREIAGPFLAARARARIAGGRVTIEVGSARWAAEVSALEAPLRARIEAALGAIDEIVIEVAGPAGPGAPPPRSGSAYQAPAVIEPEAPAGIAARCRAITDPGLSRQLERTAARYLAGRRKRTMGTT